MKHAKRILIKLSCYFVSSWLSKQTKNVTPHENGDVTVVTGIIYQLSNVEDFSSFLQLIDVDFEIRGTTNSTAAIASETEMASGPPTAQQSVQKSQLTAEQKP